MHRGPRKVPVPIYIPKSPKASRGLLLSSEPLFQLTFSRKEDGAIGVAELTKGQVIDVLMLEGIDLIKVEPAVDSDGNWIKKEVRL